MTPVGRRRPRAATGGDGGHGRRRRPRAATGGHERPRATTAATGGDGWPRDDRMTSVRFGSSRLGFAFLLSLLVSLCLWFLLGPQECYFIQAGGAWEEKQGGTQKGSRAPEAPSQFSSQMLDPGWVPPHFFSKKPSNVWFLHLKCRPKFKTYPTKS